MGVRTDHLAELAAFLEDVLGLAPRAARHDFAVFDAPNGDRVELFGPEGPQPAHQFAENQVVIDGSWQHFRGPDGLVYELNELR